MNGDGPAPRAVTLTFTHTDEDHQAVCVPTSRLYEPPQWWSLLPVATTGLTLFLIAALSGTPLDLGRYAVACVVVWAVTDRLVSRAAQRRAAAGARTTEERRPVRVTVDDAGVSMDDGEFAWTGRWSHFPWYRESEGHFLLGGRDGKPALWPIPKRAATTEADLALLADLLARHATRA